MTFSRATDVMSPQPLSGMSRSDIENFSLAALDDAITALRTEDPSKEKAVYLYRQIPGILQQGKEKATQTLNDIFDGLSDADTEAFENLRLVRSMLVVTSAVIADRNRPDDAKNNPYHFESTIRLAAQAGLSDRDLMVFLSDIDIRNTCTGHPNEHLNQKGKALFNRIIAIADLPVEQRNPALKETIAEMLRTPLTPTRKQTNFEETDNFIEQARIYRDGQRKAYMEMNQAIRNVYGNHISPPDFRNPKSRPNIVLQTWQAGGDADGKFNADRWALLHGMLSLTRAAAEDHLNDIAMAQTAIKEGADQSLSHRFESASARLIYVNDALQLLKARLDHIESRFVEVDAEGKKSLKAGVDYDVIKDEFEGVYKGLNIGNVKIRNRESFTRELEANLSHLSTNLNNDNAREIMGASSWLFSQYKLTMAQIETRHTGTVLDKMMDNLFANPSFLGQIGAENLQGQKFTRLPHDTQRILMKRAVEQLTPQQRLKAIYEANPEERDSTGNFVQTHEFQKRLELIRLNPDQFGMAIIAESMPMSAEYQQFFAEAADVNTLLHTPLPEEYETLRHMDGSIEAYQHSSGDNNIRERMLATDEGWSGTHMRVAGMIPCSDSTKILGRPVTWLQVEAIRKNVMGAIKSGIARLIKWGNGASLERAGGDIFAYTRYLAQALQKYTQERGKPLDPDNSRDHILLRMACFYSHTEQGRAQRIDSPTPGKVSATLKDITAEMLGRRLELMGLVKEGTYIPQMGTLKERMHRHLSNTAYDTMLEYQAFREAVPEDSTTPVTDSWARKVACITMTGFANQSPRAASKSGEDSATRKRAIQMNDILRSAQTKHDGWFICGAFMLRTYNEYNAGQLGLSDISDFMQEEWWRRSFFSRALTAAVPSDLAAGFKKLGVLDKWNFDRAVKVGATVHTVEQDGKPKFMYDASDGVTAEEAYQAKLFYDQVLFAALTEAALGTKSVGVNNRIPFEQPLESLIATVRPADGSLKVNFGEKTLYRWKSVKDVAAQEQQALPEQILVERLEKNPGTLTERAKRLVIGTYRETLFPDIRRLLGRTGYGRRQVPSWDGVLTVEPDMDFESAPDAGLA